MLISLIMFHDNNCNRQEKLKVYVQLICTKNETCKLIQILVVIINKQQQIAKIAKKKRV